jgi:hypothetical protein
MEQKKKKLLVGGRGKADMPNGKRKNPGNAKEV